MRFRLLDDRNIALQTYQILRCELMLTYGSIYNKCVTNQLKRSYRLYF